MLRTLLPIGLIILVTVLITLGAWEQARGSMFIAIGVQSARLSCDGEIVEVVAHLTTYGDVQIVAVECDSIGEWSVGAEWVEAMGCSVERSE